MDPSPCLAPGCLNLRRTADYCLDHLLQWSRDGHRPFPRGVLAGNTSPGVPDARVAMLREAEERQPGFLIRHVQALFDIWLGEPRRPATPWERQQALALRAASRDNIAYRRRRELVPA